jgi:hypothetical protein
LLGHQQVCIAQKDGCDLAPLSSSRTCHPFAADISLISESRKTATGRAESFCGIFGTRQNDS